METAIVVFTRDLRLHDNPALHQACASARQVVPLFVVDPAIPAPPNRARFLAESLADLRQQLRDRQADLVIRDGDPAAEVIGIAAETGAQAVYLADDVSHYAARRRRALERECARHRLDLTVTPGLTVVPPGDLAPATGGSYRVFTPYWRAWRAVPWRRPYPVPGVITMAAVSQAGRIPPAGPALPRRWPAAARRPAAAGSPRGASGSWPATRTATTTWPGTRPRGSAPTCGSAASRRWRSRSARAAARAPRSRRTARAARNSAASWPGVTSSTR